MFDASTSLRRSPTIMAGAKRRAAFGSEDEDQLDHSHSQKRARTQDHSSDSEAPVQPKPEKKFKTRGEDDSDSDEEQSENAEDDDAKFEDRHAEQIRAKLMEGRKTHGVCTATLKLLRDTNVKTCLRGSQSLVSLNRSRCLISCVIKYVCCCHFLY